MTVALRYLEIFPAHQEIASKLFSLAPVLLHRQEKAGASLQMLTGRRNDTRSYGRTRATGTNFLLLYAPVQLFLSVQQQAADQGLGLSLFSSSQGLQGIS